MLCVGGEILTVPPTFTRAKERKQSHQEVRERQTLILVDEKLLLSLLLYVYVFLPFTCLFFLPSELTELHFKFYTPTWVPAQLPYASSEIVLRSRSPVGWSSLLQFSANPTQLHRKEAIRPRMTGWSKLGQSTYPKNLELDYQKAQSLLTCNWKHRKYLRELCDHMYLKQRLSWIGSILTPFQDLAAFLSSCTGHVPIFLYKFSSSFSCFLLLETKET